MSPRNQLLISLRVRRTTNMKTASTATLLLRVAAAMAPGETQNADPVPREDRGQHGNPV